MLQNEAKCDGAIEVKGSPCVIIEAKNEVGTRGSDSYPQLIAYCNQMLRKEVVTNCPGPTYFVDIVYPRSNISMMLFLEQLVYKVKSSAPLSTTVTIVIDAIMKF